MVLLTVALLVAQAALTPETPVSKLVGQIARLAAAEPAAYGIDTRIRTAKILTAKYPKLARQQIEDARAGLPGVLGRDAQDALVVRLVGVLAPLDWTEAENTIKSIEPERSHDRLAEAYDELCSEAGSRDASGIARAALHAGAFRLHCAEQQLAAAHAGGAGEPVQLFSRIVDAFPDKAIEQDVDYLLRVAKTIGMPGPLVIRAVNKALGAVDVMAEDQRSTLRKRAADLLRSVGASVPEHLMESPVAEEAKPTSKRDAEAEKPDPPDLPYSEALELALKLTQVLRRADALITLSRREDLTSKQQAVAAEYALSAVGELPAGGDRLVRLSMLSRDFAKRQDHPKAAMAAHMLSESFGKACECGYATCKIKDEELDCVSLVNAFAGYLDELKMSQESLGLRNVSLEARLLLFKLKELVGAETKRR